MQNLTAHIYTKMKKKNVSSLSLPLPTPKIESYWVQTTLLALCGMSVERAGISMFWTPWIHFSTPTSLSWLRLGCRTGWDSAGLIHTSILQNILTRRHSNSNLKDLSDDWLLGYQVPFAKFLALLFCFLFLCLGVQLWKYFGVTTSSSLKSHLGRAQKLILCWELGMGPLMGDICSSPLNESPSPNLGNSKRKTCE